MPGDTLGKTYCPEEFVAVVLISLVAVFVRLTVASRTTAPPGSVTIPKTMAELAVCAQAGAADINAASKTLATKILVKNFMEPHHHGISLRAALKCQQEWADAPKIKAATRVLEHFS